MAVNVQILVLFIFVNKCLFLLCMPHLCAVASLLFPVAREGAVCHRHTDTP